MPTIRLLALASWLSFTSRLVPPSWPRLGQAINNDSTLQETVYAAVRDQLSVDSEVTIEAYGLVAIDSILAERLEVARNTKPA